MSLNVPSKDITSFPLNTKLSILHYFADCEKEKEASDFKINPVNVDNLNIDCVIPGSSGTIWEGGEFHLQLNFPDDFPTNPPKAKFIPTIYHPNVDQDGFVNLDILTPNQWNKEITLLQILRSVQILLNKPNTESPLNNEANNEFLRYEKDNSDDEYAKKVKECVIISKQPTKSENTDPSKTNKPSFSFSKAGGSKSSGFSFGSKNTTSSSGKKIGTFSFGPTRPSNEQNNGPKAVSNLKPSNEETNPKSSFGSNKSSNEQNDSPKFSFGSNKSSNEQNDSPKFSFGSTKPSNEQNDSPKFSFGSNKSSNEQNDSPKFSFGSNKSSNEQNDSPKFSFGSNKSSNEQNDSPKFSFGSNKSSNEQNDSPKFSFGSNKSSNEQNDNPKPESNSTPSNEGSRPPIFSFGENKLVSPKSTNLPNNTENEKPKSTLSTIKKEVKITSYDMIPQKISKNEYVMLNEANISIVEEAAKQQGKTTLLQNVSTFKKYLQDIKTRLNKSFEFAELIATEMIIFDLNEDNMKDYVGAVKAILATNPYSYKPPLTIAKQLVRGLINRFFTRINDHDIIFKFIKELDSEDIECYLHCQIKRQIKIITEDEMKQKSFTNKSIEIPTFLKNIIAKLDKTKTGKETIFTEPEKSKIAQSIINDDLDSLKKALEEQSIDYLKFKIEMDSNERRCLPKKKHKKQIYSKKDEKTSDPTLLEYAAFYGSEKCFNYLLNEKNCKITKNISKHALCGGKENICESILKANKSFLEDLEYAIKFHHPDLFKKYFLKYYNNYNDDEKFSYEKIIKKYTTSCIKFFSFRSLRFLIEFGADVSDCMINEALKRDIHSLFIFLMGLDIDINKQDKSDFGAIHCAIRAGNLTAIKVILANPQNHPLDLNLGDHCGRTPIHFAAIVGNIDIFNLLAKQPKVELTHLDDEEMTPLHYATRQGNYDVVKRLLDVDKINPNCRNSAYMSPLHYACINGRLDIAKLLLSNPLTEVNLHDIGGWAPIHYAVDNLNVPLVTALIHHDNINPNVIDIFACENNNLDIVKLLLSHPNVDVNACDNAERSPIVVACLKKNMPIIEELLKRDDIILNKYESFKKDIDPEIFKVVDKRREELGQEPMPDS